MKKRTGIGMPGPKQVQSELRRWQRALEKSID
jgi:hypothetical protein